MLTWKLSHTIILDFLVKAVPASVHTDPGLVPTLRKIWAGTKLRLCLTVVILNMQKKKKKKGGYLQIETNHCPYYTVAMYSVRTQQNRTPPPGQSDLARPWSGRQSLPWWQSHAARQLRCEINDSAWQCTTRVDPEMKWTHISEPFRLRKSVRGLKAHCFVRKIANFSLKIFICKTWMIFVCTALRTWWDFASISLRHLEVFVTCR